jgi:Fanconi anemia group M protein
MKTIITKPIFDIFSKKTRNKKAEEGKQMITVDYRERNSLVASKLVKLGFDVEFKELKVGDYIVQNTVIERKTINDFISSMINKRIMRQIEELKQLDKKLLIIEGFEENELYSESNKEKSGVNPNAIRGFLLSIVLKHKIPLIFTKNHEDSAIFMSVLSKKKEKEISLKPKKRISNKKEQLQFIIEGFPGIGIKTSKKLLEEFGTVQNIVNAPEENLREILGKKTELFLEIIGRKY